MAQLEHILEWAKTCKNTSVVFEHRYKRCTIEEEATMNSSFCSLGCSAAPKRDALTEIPYSLLHIPMRNTIKSFSSHGNSSTYVEKKRAHNILLNSPISNIGCNYLLKFHYWKNNKLIITFSNLAVDNLSVLCPHCQNIWMFNTSLTGQFVCSPENTTLWRY